MAMEVDGTAVLTAIVKNPEVFALSGAQVNTLAATLLTARFKDKAVTLDHLKRIAGLLGGGDFRLALDHLAGKDAAVVAKRLDPKHPDLKTASEGWYREHISKLADGSVTPTIAATKTPAKRVAPSKTATKSKTGDVMESKALKPKTQSSRARKA